MTTSTTLLAAGIPSWIGAQERAREGITSAGAPLRIGTVTLVVRDLDTVSRFYQDAIGLSLHTQETDRHRLGTPTTTLLELVADPHAAPSDHTQAGLFHTAFLLPTRPHLAQWILHAAATGIPIQGASDHGVSEAIYLADPEGNGIEIYHDRPSVGWTWKNGLVQMGTRRLDLQGLAQAAEDSQWRGAPDGTVIGHIHLQVGALAPAQAFYTTLLGMEVVAQAQGALFYASGGYHHHIATNTWNSAGVGGRPDGQTGLHAFEVVPKDKATAQELVQRLHGHETTQWSAGIQAIDPWGTRVRLRLDTPTHP